MQEIKTFRAKRFVITATQNNRKHERFGHCLIAYRVLKISIIIRDVFNKPIIANFYYKAHKL